MKCNYFQEEKLKYENIEIPDELLFVVRQTVAADRRKKAARQRTRILKMAGSVAAILFLCLTIGVNSSYAFAETIVKIPVVKNVAKAVIVRSYKADIIALDEQNSGQPEKAPDMGQEPEEAVPSVSDNNVISGNETSDEPSAEQEPEEELEGFDAWKAEMTAEKFDEVTELYTVEMEERYADTPEKLRTILLAELPEKEVSLYGYHEDGRVTGTALRVKDTYQYFDWNYMNSTKKLPEISSADADGDGTEEIIVFLYNGEAPRKAVSKEEIEEPGSSAQNTISGNNNIEEMETESVESSVSGNDIKEPEKPKEAPKQQAGELWVVSLEEENWTAGVLSIDDYESQILHQLKAEYDEEAGTVQLYLMEEPFGKPVKLSFEEEELTWENAAPAPEREFITEKGLSLHFQMEAVFSDEDGEEVRFPLNLNLKAEIHLEDGSLTVENIKER